MNEVELQCLAILHAALDEDYGIVVHTNDPYRARAMCYRVRQLAQEDVLDQLTIRVSPDDAEHEIWIIHNTSQLIDLPSTSLL